MNNTYENQTQETATYEPFEITLFKAFREVSISAETHEKVCGRNCPRCSLLLGRHDALIDLLLDMNLFKKYFVWSSSAEAES